MTPKSDLPARLGVVALGIPLAVAVVYVGSWPLGLVLALFAAVGAWEFYAMAGAVGAVPFRTLGSATGALLVLAAAGTLSLAGYAVAAFGLLLALTLVSLALCVWVRWPNGKPFLAASTTVTGAAYVGGALAFALLLRHLPEPGGAAPSAFEGSALLFFPVVVTWIGDSCAYFGGRAFGKRKLIPRVSPGKTVAGAVASVLGSTAAAVVWIAFVVSPDARPGLGLGAAAVMGVVLSGAAQTGDLVASVLKREAGVKDSGRLFPGHGGALDRLDALLYTIPLAYVMVLVAGALA